MTPTRRETPPPPSRPHVRELTNDPGGRDVGGGVTGIDPSPEVSVERSGPDTSTDVRPTDRTRSCHLYMSYLFSCLPFHCSPLCFLVPEKVGSVATPVSTSSRVPSPNMDSFRKMVRRRTGPPGPVFVTPVEGTLLPQSPRRTQRDSTPGTRQGRTGRNRCLTLSSGRSGLIVRPSFSPGLRGCAGRLFEIKVLSQKGDKEDYCRRRSPKFGVV